jgi:integrase
VICGYFSGFLRSSRLRSKIQTCEGTWPLSLDASIETKLIAAAAVCGWRAKSFELFRDVVVLMRETGMRNERELYRIRIESIDWLNKLIFIPDSKTPSGRRNIPMSEPRYGDTQCSV